MRSRVHWQQRGGDVEPGAVYKHDYIDDCMVKY